MGKIIPFEKNLKRTNRPLHRGTYGNRSGHSPRRTARVFLAPILFSALLTGAFAFTHMDRFAPDSEAELSTSFTLCGRGPRYNCVVDGDTFYFRGEKIRVADINTPETHSPDCEQEARLGEEARFRFLELLNSGPVAIVRRGARDIDRYGRQLRVVMRHGHSLGDDLIAEGLARRWSGRRGSWCA